MPTNSIIIYSLGNETRRVKVNPFSFPVIFSVVFQGLKYGTDRQPVFTSQDLYKV